MEKKPNLRQFEKELIALKRRCQCSNISEDQVNECLVRIFRKKEQSGFVSAIVSAFSFILRVVLALIILVAASHVVLSYNPTKRFLSRNIQSLIYPSMRLFRLWTLPFVKSTNLAHLYQTSCLIENPFYITHDVDCWPCENTKFVMDLSDVETITYSYYQSGTPFIVKKYVTDAVSLSDLRNAYINHSTILNQGTFTLLNQKSLMALVDVFEADLNDSTIAKSDVQIQWGVNQVPAVHVMRQLFKRPKFIPNDTEIALQRFIFIDGLQSRSYKLPFTDFVNIWLAQHSGIRLIVLKPSDQCERVCSVVSVLLRPKDILFYNSQYWHPWSYPVNISEDVSISYMGSSY